MTPIPLSIFVEAKGQDEAARFLGSSQAAISKALKSGRLILVSEESPDVFSAVEFKGFPASGPSQKPRPDLEEIVLRISNIVKSADDAGILSSSTEAAR